MRKHKLWKFKRKEVLAYNQDLEKSMGLRYYKRELNFVPILKEKNESEKYSHCEESCFLLVFSPVGQPTTCSHGLQPWD